MSVYVALVVDLCSFLVAHNEEEEGTQPGKTTLKVYQSTYDCIICILAVRIWRGYSQPGTGECVCIIGC